jgi:Leucine-rich repeat (LRR) protein
MVKADESLCGQDFYGLDSLKKLTIIGCKSFEVIEREVFQCMPNLEWIGLEFCPINSIRPGVFSCVPNLKRLEIRDTWLNDCAPLRELTSLETLDLSDNKIRTVNRLTADLSLINTTLKVLRLRGNQISSLNARAFAQLSALEILDLKFNPIQAIERGAFRGLGNLQKLLLDESDLIEPFEISYVFDPELASLRVLDLANLRILDDLYGWKLERFRTAIMNGGFQKIFPKLKAKKET